MIKLICTISTRGNKVTSLCFSELSPLICAELKHKIIEGYSDSILIEIPLSDSVKLQVSAGLHEWLSTEELYIESLSSEIEELLKEILSGKFEDSTFYPLATLTLDNDPPMEEELEGIEEFSDLTGEFMGYRRWFGEDINNSFII